MTMLDWSVTSNVVDGSGTQALMTTPFRHTQPNLHDEHTQRIHLTLPTTWTLNYFINSNLIPHQRNMKRSCVTPQRKHNEFILISHSSRSTKNTKTSLVISLHNKVLSMKNTKKYKEDGRVIRRTKVSREDENEPLWRNIIIIKARSYGDPRIQVGFQIMLCRKRVLDMEHITL